MLAYQATVPETLTSSARDRHVERLVSRLDSSLGEGPADLVVLPELVTIDYSRSAFARLEALAEDLDGPSYQRFASLAARHRAPLVYSFPRRSDRGYRICLSVLGPDGDLIGYYDKLHLAQYGASMEKEYFEPGDRLLLFSVAGITIAPAICYDIRFPGLFTKLCGDLGADLVVHCGAYYRDPSYPSWPSFVVTRALENQVYVLSLNRAGDSYGGSMFCPPWIDQNIAMTRLGNSEELAYFDVDKGEIARVRETYSFRKDARADYNQIGLRRTNQV